MDIKIKGLGDVPELDKIMYDQLTASGIQIHNCGLRMYHDDMIYLLRVGQPSYGLFYWQYADEYDDFCDWRIDNV